MDISTFKDLIDPKLYILIVAMYIIGMVAKKSTVVADKHIPVLLGVISIVLAGLWTFATHDIVGGKAIAMAVFTAIMQGILCAGASVYVNQIIKQNTPKG